MTGLSNLLGAIDGLNITRTEVDRIPLTIFRADTDAKGPTVVIAHGFAGSQALMQPFAITLAQNGYTAVTFDFPGHGRNPVPLQGGITDTGKLETQLIAALGKVVDFADHLPHADGRTALLGHSMATDMVARYAQAHPAIAATVLVSPFAPTITAETPKNLDIIVGNLEPAMLKDEALRVLALATGGPESLRTTYGDFAAGTARRVSFSGGVEHIGVLYSAQSLTEALDWLNAVFHHVGDGTIDAPGLWLALFFAGLIGVTWPVSAFLPVLSPVALGASLPWRRLLPIAIAPAILTPLILWKLPTSFLPILLGDYLAVHFLVYGLLSLAMLRLFRIPLPTFDRTQWRTIVGTGITVGIYTIVVIGSPIDSFITSFRPIAMRVPLILAILVGTLPFFIADEWIARGARHARLSYAFTKLCFLLSLAIAVALNIERLFFLIIIIPVMLIFFLVFGLFSRWTYNRTNQPWAGAVALALVFAWSIAVTFPTIAP
jgi:pimeloyl-ACP methyl ester carboxylesterase